MTEGKAIGMLAGALAGVVVLLFGLVLRLLAIGHNWLLVTALFGGATGLVIGYLLTKAQVRNSELEKQVDKYKADLRKSIQDSHFLTEEHERDRKELIQKQALYEQVFNRMNSGVLVVSKNGKILLANRPALSLLRLDNQVTGKSLNVGLPSLDVWRGGATPRDRSTAHVTLRDGSDRLFGYSTSPLEDGGFVVVFQDITVAVEIQERKRRAEELSLVGEMASRLSHEIKNPLGSIFVGVRTLLRDTQQSSQHGHILQLISEEVNSLVKIVNQLLDSARPRTPFPRQVSIESLLERCVDAQAPQAVRRGVRLEIVRFPVSTLVLLDDQSMLIALGSLIQNALDACSRGDLIRIGWTEPDQAGRDELVPGFPGKVVSLFVEDNGSGVPDELSSNESRIFKAFVSTKASGTGLGLTVAQDIVEEFGGVIMVRSRSNRGTRVEILLPIPDAIPCWEWSHDQSVDCTSCDVRSAGTGYCCWKQKQSTYHDNTGQWPSRCLRCGFFRASSLTPFFRSRLVVAQQE